MRLSALYILCAAALTIPTFAAPLAMSTVLDTPVAHSATVILNGPSEVPNLPQADKHSAASTLKTWSRPEPLPIPLRRGVTFRQADYGANPNATFDALAPVQGIEATPTTDAVPAAHSRRSSDDYWEANHLSGDDYSYNNLAEVDTPSPTTGFESPSLSSTSDIPHDVENADDASSPAASGAAHDPVSLADPNPMTPDRNSANMGLSTLFNSASKGVELLGKTHYAGGDQAHQLLAQGFGNGTSRTVPTTKDLNKSHMDVEKTDRHLYHSVHRRVLAPAQYLTNSAPARRVVHFARDIAQFVSRHSMELNTDAVLPTRPDPTLDMSDPVVAQEAARKKNIGLMNIDSNQAPPSPPFNTTQTQVYTAAKNATHSA